MIKFLLGLIVAVSITPSFSTAALSPSDRQAIPYENTAASINSGFENGISKWVSSPAITLASSTPQAGSKYAQWNSTSAAQTLTLGSIGRPEGQLEATCAVRVPSGTATHTFKVVESSGSTTVASMSIENSTTWRYQTLIFPSPAAGTLSIVFTSVAADEPSIDIDDCYVGRARNVGSTQLIGEWTSFTPTIGLTGGSTTAYGKWRQNGGDVEVSFDATFTTVFTGGTASVSLPSACSAIDTTKLPTGYATGVGLPNSNLRLYDVGTGQWGGSIVYNDTTTVLMRTWTDDVGAGGNHVQVDAVISTTIPFTWANNDRVSGYFKVPCVGWQAQTIVMPDAQGWYVDASISGANPSLGTSSVTSYTGIENGSLTMTQNSGSAAVQIGCSSTNAPSGLTCSSGNESLSVAFTPPKSGTYRACVTANHYIDAPAGSINVVSTFQIVETATNAQTVLQEGKGKAMSGSVSISGDRREYRSVATCGDFVLSAGAQRMLRLMYETEISGTPDNHYIKADGDSVLGQPDVHWTVYPLQNPASAILANSVSTGTTNGERVERATIASGCASVTSSSGTWVSSVSKPGTGQCTVNILAGSFSSAPTCVCTVNVERTCRMTAVPSTASFTVDIFNGGSPPIASDSSINVICMGPR